MQNKIQSNTFNSVTGMKQSQVQKSHAALKNSKFMKNFTQNASCIFNDLLKHVHKTCHFKKKHMISVKAKRYLTYPLHHLQTVLI
jgi:CRISPR/Cas system endoribonuclease Cas6 (RAMP superfamily)